MAFGLAVYASQGRLPFLAQDSLPGAGQALLDGLLPARSQYKVSNHAIFPLIQASWRNLTWSWLDPECILIRFLIEFQSMSEPILSDSWSNPELKHTRFPLQKRKSGYAEKIFRADSCQAAVVRQ
jgi:hypothetical protein